MPPITHFKGKIVRTGVRLTRKSSMKNVSVGRFSANIVAPKYSFRPHFFSALFLAFLTLDVC
jgi:hypothetical protein